MKRQQASPTLEVTAPCQHWRPSRPRTPGSFSIPARTAEVQSSAHQSFAQNRPEHLTHSELENLLEAEGRELLRLLLQGHLDERAPGTSIAPVVDAIGRTHTHLRTHRRQLETVFGTVSVTRTGYGGRGIESLYPFDAALNLPPERYSHTLRRRGGRTSGADFF